MNYQELFDTIKGYVENDFPDTIHAGTSGTDSTFTSKEQIDTFIKQAEQRIFNTVQFPSLRKNVTGQCTVNNQYLACPDDFLASYSLTVVDNNGSHTFLLNKDVNFIREAFPSPAVTGVPQYYALWGPRYSNPSELSFILGPTPNTNYSMELHYFFYPESIVTAGTTWLGDNFDSVLLYGSLIEAYTFMKGESDMIQVYEAKYQDALKLAKRLGDGLDRRDAYRSGQTRIDVQ